MNIIKINHQFAFLFNIPENHLPMKFELGKMSCTLIPEQADAFTLEPIISGWAKDVEMGKLENQKVGNRGLILRTCIGYAAMSRIDNNFTIGCLIIANVINAMLYEAHQYQTNHLCRFKKLTFEQPGYSNQFFRELETNAGFELRLYIEF